MSSTAPIGRPVSSDTHDRDSEVVSARLGVVSFLNTRPIISGLEDQPGMTLVPMVPSRLIDEVVKGEVDAALCSSIDYLRSPVPLQALRVAPLTCNGPTLTVRLFSRVPLENIDVVHCDTDSHTSVALLRILMQDLWKRNPDFIDHEASAAPADGVAEWPDTVMLIGGKVMTHAPTESTHPHQFDLGEAWKELTGFPFVFALWLARADTPDHVLSRVSEALADQLACNIAEIDSLVQREAPEHGWPVNLARTYLNGLIRYELGPEQLAGVQAFHERARKHGLVEYDRSLVFFGD